MKYFIFFFILTLTTPTFAQEITVTSTEVMNETGTLVRVREQSAGDPYIAIVDVNHEAPKYIFQKEHKPYSRPDYRLLSDKVKKGEIPYDGPKSDRKKVYILAGTLVATGIATTVAAPAAGVAAATTVGTGVGGGSLFITAGTVIGTGSIWAAMKATEVDPDQDRFIHESKARLLEIVERDG